MLAPCCCTRGQERVAGSLASSFKWGEGGGGSGGLPTALVVLCKDHVQYPAFAPGTSEVAVGFEPFCILLS